MKQRTRIVCTLGPASDSDDVVRGMIRAGMDVARLNFSHGDQAAHGGRIERVRRIAQEEKALIALLADLQGPKIRVGSFRGEAIHLVAGAAFTLTTRAVVGDANGVSVDYPALAESVKPGQRILLDDGLIELQATSAGGTEVATRVITGGE